MQIQAPAKINLFFEVERRREDGFHDIDSLICPVSLYDTLVFQRREDSELRLKMEYPALLLSKDETTENASSPFTEGTQPTEISADSACPRTFSGDAPLNSEIQACAQIPQIPADETNLVLRAARLLQSTEAAKSKKLPGVSIITQKRIPSEAGLGGGSSDAAATLLVLNQLWELGLSQTELQCLGFQLGCDVPLFLGRFPVIAQGRGERLAEVPAGETLPVLHFVLVKPAKGLSTPAVYRSCTPRNVAQDGDSSHASAEALLQAWRSGDLQGVASNLFNRLEKPAFRLLPELHDLRTAAEHMVDPCLGFAMTGSGSACFGLCRDAEHAQRAAKELSGLGTAFAVTSVLQPLQAN